MEDEPAEKSDEPIDYLHFKSKDITLDIGGMPFLYFQKFYVGSETIRLEFLKCFVCRNFCNFASFGPSQKFIPSKSFFP